MACSRASTTELPTTSIAAGAKPSSMRNSRLSSTGAACRSEPASQIRVLNCSGDGSLLPLDQLLRSIDCSRNDAQSRSAPCSIHPRSTSGLGDSVRSPASTCTSACRSPKVASEPAIAVVVSPWT